MVKPIIQTLLVNDSPSKSIGFKYGERFNNSKDRPKGKIPKGEAKCVKAVSDAEDKYPNEFSYNEATKTIILGDGAFAPVGKKVWEFEVSGFKPVQSWLGYRMRERKGKKIFPA